MKYKNKTILIDAIQYTGDIDQVKQFQVDLKFKLHDDKSLYIPTPMGNMKVSINDYIVRFIDGSIYPCSNVTFNKTYETIE